MAEVNAALKSAYADGFYGRAVATNLYGGYLTQLWNADGSIHLTDSKNWQGVGVLCDALNAVNGHPHLKPLDELFRWMAAYLRWQQANGWMNHEQFAYIYLRHHMGFVRGMRAIALRKGGQAELVAPCDWWLLVALVQTAITRTRVPARLFTAAERQPLPGPGAYKATAPSSSYGNVLCGQRMESTKNDGAISVDASPAEGLYLEAVQGVMPKGGYGVVLKLNHYDYGFGLDSTMKSLLAATAKRDLSAARSLISKVASTKCALLVQVEWAGGGLNAIAPKLPGGSTLGLGVHVIDEPSGEQRFLLAGNGGRDTGAHDDDIGPSTATVDWAARTVSIRRDDTGQTAGPIKLAAGPRVALFEWGPNGHRVVEPVEPVVDAPTPPINPDLPTTGGQEKNAGCFARLFGR